MRKSINIFCGIFEDNISDYKTYDHDQFIMTTGLRIYWYGYYLHDSAFSLDIATVYIVLWSWFTLSDIIILLIDLWSCYTESHTVLHMNWLIKSTKSGLLGETGSRESGRCAWKGGFFEGLAEYDFVISWLCDSVIMCALIVIWNLSTLNFFFILFRIHKAHYLIDMHTSCEWSTGWLR